MTVIHEGFWGLDNRPVPNAEPWPGQREFLDALWKVEQVAKMVSYRGWSNCLVCGCANGSMEFSTDRAVWPSGFKHYIDDHNVRPSQEFIDYVLNYGA